MKGLYVFLFGIVLCTSLSADVIMGVVPQQSPLKLLKVWQPIAEYLCAKTGEKILFKTEKSIDTFEKALYDGKYDFAYMNPYHYVLAHKKQGYIAHIRSKKQIRGILVMKNGDDLQGITNKDTCYLFPSPNAFAATLLTKHELIQEYHVDVETLNKAVYVNSHDSVYKGVSRGIGTVGGGIERTFENLNDPAAKKSLKVVHTTKAYPSHPFAFKPSMDQALKERIVNALLAMPQELLQTLSVKAFIKIDNAEYDRVKDLAVKLKIMPE